MEQVKLSRSDKVQLLMISPRDTYFLSIVKMVAIME